MDLNASKNGVILINFDIKPFLCSCRVAVQIRQKGISVKSGVGGVNRLAEKVLKKALLHVKGATAIGERGRVKLLLFRRRVPKDAELAVVNHAVRHCVNIVKGEV